MTFNEENVNRDTGGRFDNKPQSAPEAQLASATEQAFRQATDMQEYALIAAAGANTYTRACAVLSVVAEAQEAAPAARTAVFVWDDECGYPLFHQYEDADGNPVDIGDEYPDQDLSAFDDFNTTRRSGLVGHDPDRPERFTVHIPEGTPSTSARARYWDAVGLEAAADEQVREAAVAALVAEAAVVAPDASCAVFRWGSGDWQDPDHLVFDYWADADGGEVDADPACTTLDSFDDWDSTRRHPALRQDTGNPDIFYLDLRKGDQ